MDGKQLRAIRHALGLSVVQMGRALGYTGNDNTLSVQIRRYELGTREPIPPWIWRLATMFDRHGVPDEWVE